LTLTAGASAVATTLTGTVAGAAIGTAETATFTIALPTGSVVAGNSV
jgi:hypothetical protein